MTDFTDTVFDCQFLEPSQLLVKDLRFTKCFFDNCSLGKTDHPSRRLIIRNVEIRNCKQRASDINNAAIEDAIIDGIGKEGRLPLFSWAAVFRHVTLKGKLSAIKLNQFTQPVPIPSLQQLWDDANRLYYQSVDWALDIRQAEFQGGIDLHCVPGSLVRRDPETQVLAKRAVLNSVDWRNLPWDKSSLWVAIDWFLKDGLYDDVVLIASKRSAGFKDDMRSIAMLRERGIVECD
jgi:hypothetical protein